MLRCRRASHFCMLDMVVTFVDTEEQLLQLQDALTSTRRIAIDVEWRPDSLLPRNGAAAQSSPAALLQIAMSSSGGSDSSGAAKVYLIDLLALHVRALLPL